MENKFSYAIMIKIKKIKFPKKFKTALINFKLLKCQRLMLNLGCSQVTNFIKIISNKTLLTLKIELKILKQLVTIFVGK